MKTAFIILFLILIAFILLPNLLTVSAATDISQDDLLKKMKSDDDYILLDVRSKEEFNMGHIKGAINISHTEITKHLEQLPSDKDLILYCRTGRRVGLVAKELTKQGYGRLFHLQGDITDWIANKRPIIVD